MFIRLFLIVILFPLQSCSNTLIGEKLENSFDTNENLKTSEKIDNKPQKLNKEPKIKSRIMDEKEDTEKGFGQITKVNSIANKDRSIQKTRKLVLFQRFSSTIRSGTHTVRSHRGF